MPTYPLPPDAPIGGGDLVCAFDEDVAEVLPFFINESDSAPVRDAIKAAIVEMLLEYQRQSATLAGNHDEARAEGMYLDGLGGDKELFRQANEIDRDYRARQLLAQLVVSPDAICVAVNAILEPHTDITCKYFEHTDGWFVGDSSTVWSSHVFDGNGNRSPHYQDRLYPDDSVENGGYSCEHRGPGGAVVFSDNYGRLFVLRIPDLAFVDEQPAAMFDGTNTVDGGFFVGDGTSVVDMTYISVSADSEYDIYQAVINVVERLKGHGIRWALFADPQLQ